MSEFFKGQFDYIYFFYGFSFFLMSLICFTLSRDKLRKFPWVLLGGFGFFHGLHEWTDMLGIIYGGSLIFSIINLCALITSYLFLFEFARLGYLRLTGKKIKRWAYLFFLILLPVGYRYGLDGWHIMSRYFLGFSSGYFASRVIYEFARKESEGRRPLILLSLFIGLYSVFTGLVVPRAGFFLARLLNNESFFDTFNMPIELIRGVIALCAAMAIWVYSAMPSEEKHIPTYAIRFVPTKWMIAATMVLFISAGWLFTNYLDYYAGIRIIKTRAIPQLNMLTNELTLLSKAAYSLSMNPAIKTALSSPDQPQNIGKSEAVLKRFKDRFGALNCALIDAAGFPVASIADAGSDMITGKSYSRMPYFREALHGDNGYYFKLAPVHNERIYYVSYPVRGAGGKIPGIVVLEKKIHAEPLFQFRLFSIMITFIVCIIAIVFFIALRKREAAIRLIEKAHSALEEADRMKTDFISTLSHELRTPLTSIKSAAEILIKDGPAHRVPEKEEKELLEIILDSTGRQARMVNDLLDISKIESGVMQVSPKPVDITAIIGQAATSFKLLAEKKKLTIALITDIPEKMVFADPELVRRILNNLLSNAINFTHANGKITVRAEGLGKEMRVGVSDTGIGISQADKEILFTKFCVIAKPSSQHAKGCGLGLAITKGLVEAQKGKIWAESKPGKGSTFYFTLPRAGK